MFGIKLPDLPWNFIAYAVGIIGIFLAGYFYHGGKEERSKLKAREELHKKISAARSRILIKERKGQREIEEIKDVAKKNDSREFASFANRLLRKIFKPRKN